MGRKPKNDGKIWVTDRVGEKVDLNNSPVCVAHPDCFAWVNGHCTALKRNADTSECTFYTPADKGIESAKRGFQRLKETGRSDLIMQYIKTLSALGALDEDFSIIDQYADEFASFREQNYQEQLEEEMEKAKQGDDETAPEGDTLMSLFADVGDEFGDETMDDSLNDTGDVGGE